MVAAASAALASGRARAGGAEWRGVALGAAATITLRGDESRAEAALARARLALEEAEALFSLHRPTSALSVLNRDGAVRAGPLFTALLRISDQLHRATGGRFDPTVQPLWRALAEGGDLSAARRLIGWERVGIGARTRLGEGQALTLNGVAQGFATDLVSEALAAEGFHETLVNIGEFRAGAGDWRVGVAEPDGVVLRAARLSGGAIATSSPGAMTVGGAPHILSPTGAAPVWTTVSVEARTATVADGLSTALCHADAAEAARIARAIGGVRRLTLVRDGDFRVVEI